MAKDSQYYGATKGMSVDALQAVGAFAALMTLMVGGVN